MNVNSAAPTRNVLPEVRFNSNSPVISSVLPENNNNVDRFEASTTHDDQSFLTLGRNRFRKEALPEQLADIQLNYIDGSTVSVPDGAGLVKQLGKTKDGTLDSLVPSGHGQDSMGSSSMGFDINDEGAAGMTSTKGSKTPRVTVDVVNGRFTKQVDLGKMLEGKFAPGGARLIDLRACDTGNFNGLGHTISKIVPGIRVQGTSGTLLENKITGSETPAAGPEASHTYVVPRSQANYGAPGVHNPFPTR